MSEATQYETVVGLEVHVELHTNSKIFAAAPPLSELRLIRIPARSALVIPACCRC